MLRPGSRPAHPGFEKWLVTLQNMATDGLTHPDGRPKKLFHGALSLVESVIHPAGGARLVPPLLQVSAVARALRKGIGRQLAERHYLPAERFDS